MTEGSGRKKHHQRQSFKYMVNTMVWRRWALRHSQAAGQPQILAVYMRAAWDLWWPGQGAADPTLCRTAETPAIASGTFHGQNLSKTFSGNFWQFQCFPPVGLGTTIPASCLINFQPSSACLEMCVKSPKCRAKASALRSWTNMQRRLSKHCAATLINSFFGLQTVF